MYSGQYHVQQSLHKYSSLSTCTASNQPVNQSIDMSGHQFTCKITNSQFTASSSFPPQQYATVVKTEWFLWVLVVIWILVPAHAFIALDLAIIVLILMLVTATKLNSVLRVLAMSSYKEFQPREKQEKK